MYKLFLSSINQVSSGAHLENFAEKCTKHALKLNKCLNSFTEIINNKNIQFKDDETNHHSPKIRKPLHGIPFALKDNFCTKNLRTTCGSEMLKDFMPSYNATVFNRLLKAGAVLIGKCNMDQFGMGSGCVDSMFGPTRNIWGDYSEKSVYCPDQNWRISGGSSGGSAVAVASGACAFALGSDTGGSVRNPASYCGVVGFKPTYGLVSRHGLIPLVNSMDVPGIITRSIADCVSVLNCIAGPDELDSTTFQSPFTEIQLPKLPDVKGVRIGIPKEYHCSGMSDEVVSIWMKIADLMQDAGAIVKQVSMPNTSASIAVYSILNQCEVSSNMARYDGIEYGLRPKETLENDSFESTEQLYAESRSRGFNNVVKNRILAGNYFLLEGNYEKYFVKAMQVRRLIANDFNQVFNGENCVDILLTPTTLSEAPTYKEFTEKENRDQCSIQDYCTQPANMAGVPAVSLPIKLSSVGLPLSLQLMGPHLGEEKLLTTALWIEQLVDFQNIYAELLNERIQMYTSIS